MMTKFWYGKPSLLNYFLLSFTWMYRAIIFIRRYFIKPIKCNVPVIVVGNITVGGTGKTPFVIWLANFLKENNFKPGIVSRGYGGKSAIYPLAVNKNSDPKVVGDEPVLLAQHTHCPVVVDPHRVRAVEYLLKNYDCNIVISDDGLQHYKLARDIEIVIVDGDRKFGNALCLPAGPLREPLSRLKNINFMITNGEDMKLIPDKFYNLSSPELKADFEDFQGVPIHAVAGIGNPDRFFKLLREKGLSVMAHTFPDHYLFAQKDFDFDKENKILMTEKDAVKCKAFADYRYWYLPVKADVDEKIGRAILERIKVR